MCPLITIDYGISGNGTGEISETIVKPMKRIRLVCDRYEAKVNIFFEVSEYTR